MTVTTEAGTEYVAGDGAGAVPGSCYYAAEVRKCGCELDKLSKVLDPSTWTVMAARPSRSPRRVAEEGD